MQHDSPEKPVRYAIIVRGPLAHFTAVVLRWYLNDARGLGLGRHGVGVVFSHNYGSCANTTFLAELKALHPNSFDWVLRDVPPQLGIGYRNAQREASHHGIAVAMQRWDPEFVLVHRPDAVFQDPDALPRLAALLRAQPSPTDLPAGRSRLGFGASQTMLTDFYGRFHLDDHVVFGRAADVAAYWSVDNPRYCNRCTHSTHLPAVIRAQRSRCFIPGPESELGELWVRWERDTSGAPLPASTAELLAARGFIVNTAKFGHASVLHPHQHAFAAHVKMKQLPLQPLENFQHKAPGRSVRRREPFGVMSLCSRLAVGTYDCASVQGARALYGRPTDWPCPYTNASARSRHASCVASAAQGSS